MMKKQPLILLPGLLCDDELWKHQRDNLAHSADITVADLSPYDSMAMMAQSVLATAPPVFSLAGLSMGGFVAFEIVRMCPERVATLILLGTSARPDTKEQTLRRKQLSEMGMMGKFGRVLQILLPWVVHRKRLNDNMLVESFLKMANRIGPERFARNQRAIINRSDNLANLSDIHCPTLIVCGREDKITPLELHEEMARGIKNSRLAVIEECGHLSTMEQPRAVTDVLRDWLLRG